MNHLSKKRHVFCPTITQARLEERVVLSTAVVAPLPALPAVSLASLRLTTAKLRAIYVQQFQAATADLRSAVKTDVSQLYANGSVPTTQQFTDFNASVAGAVNATALRLSSQAALLPNAGVRLVPAIQNSLLGSGSSSLASRLTSIANSSRFNGSAQTLQSALMTRINTASLQNIAQTRSFINTTSLNRLSVNSSGQQIPVQQYMAGQLLSQLGNTFGSLAQSFPAVANSMLFPNDVTTTTATTTSPTQQLFDEFGLQVRGALSTAAFQLGSDLAVFSGSSGVVPQIQPALFGSSTSTSTSLIAALQNLPYGSTDFNTAVGTAFNTAFQNLVTPLTSFLRIANPSNISLPTSGITSPFGSQFSTSTFNSGFNNGFATGTNTGFIGFGSAPTTFNTNFGSGFGTLINSLNTTSGLLGSTGVAGGVPYQTR